MQNEREIQVTFKPRGILPLEFVEADHCIEVLRQEVINKVLLVLDHFRPDIRGSRLAMFIDPWDERYSELIYYQLFDSFTLLASESGSLAQLFRRNRKRLGMIVDVYNMFQPGGAALVGVERAKKWRREAEKLLMPYQERVYSYENLISMALDRLINEPDSDFKLPSGIVASEVFDFCKGIGLYQECFPVCVDEETEIFYGYQINLSQTRTSKVGQLSIVCGYFQRREGQYKLVNIDLQADFLETPSGHTDLRGDEGISSDRQRATLDDSGDCYRFKGSLQHEPITFPKSQILQRINIFLTLASRAVNHSVSQRREVVIPDLMPEITPDAVAEIFEEYPNLRVSVSDKIRDAFFINPKEAFKLCWKLGLWKASEIMSQLSDEQLQSIYEKLPSCERHLQAVEAVVEEGNVAERYSVFREFALLVNECLDELDYQGGRLDPDKGWLMLPLEIFK